MIPVRASDSTQDRGTDTKPLVSVIIPCYNHGHFVGEAIDSVCAQTYLHYEIVVVDDGSTDRTAEAVGRYPGVRYVRQRNQGLPAARNRGIQESRGEYLVFLDADDRLLPDHLAISLEAFRSHPEAGWVCGNFRFLGSDPTWQHVHRCERLSDDFATLLSINFIAAVHTVVVKRAAVVAVGGFNEQLLAYEDHDLFLRLARQFPLHCHHRIVAEYRRSGQQLSQRWDVMLKFAMHTYRGQWKYVRGHKAYEEAYWEGVSRVRAHYGDKAVWQMVGHLRSSQWLKAVKIGGVLISCYPQGFARLIEDKVARTLGIRKQLSP